ncbi:MAG: hypothetical protein LBU77_02505, partial [Clostridiales bacterium]|nr:hypothetical protein [Clostridiales bacterium]
RKTKFQQEGGFNLHLAMQDIMKNADPEKTPVILFATDEDESMVYIPKRMKNHAYPELEFYYRLTESPYAANLILTPYSLITNYKFDTVTRPTVKQARAYQGKAVISDGRDRLVILNETPAEQTNNPYLDAMALAVEGKINLKNGVKNPLGYIKRSFLSHVLTPATAFIVVETKQQEEDLLALQEKILKADAEQENGPSLAEPSLGALLLTVCLYLLISKKRKRCVLYEKNANCITTACLKTPFCEIARFIQSFKTRPVDTEPALGDQPTDSHRERRGRLRGLFKRL